jgi:hypothetical protein
VAGASWFGRGLVSDRWDRGLAVDPLAAEAGDAAVMILANPVALPMHDHAFDRPR